MTAEKLIVEYFKGGNAQNIKINRELKEILEVIKEMSDKLDTEGKEKNQGGGVYPEPNPLDSNK